MRAISLTALSSCIFRPRPSCQIRRVSVPVPTSVSARGGFDRAERGGFDRAEHGGKYMMKMQSKRLRFEAKWTAVISTMNIHWYYGSAQTSSALHVLALFSLRNTMTTTFKLVWYCKYLKFARLKRNKKLFLKRHFHHERSLEKLWKFKNLGDYFSNSFPLVKSDL